MYIYLIIRRKIFIQIQSQYYYCTLKQEKAKLSKMCPVYNAK
jgi:hypothetical protein